MAATVTCKPDLLGAPPGAQAWEDRQGIRVVDGAGIDDTGRFGALQRTFDGHLQSLTGAGVGRTETAMMSSAT
jgi:hypothetical protein